MGHPHPGVNTSLLVFLQILAWLIGSGEQIALYAALIERTTGVGFDVARLSAGATPWVIGIAASVGLFASVTVHELGHSWVAMRYGNRIESITLWILGGMAALATVPREWSREFWIAIAGPVTSLLVTAACFGGVFVVPGTLAVPRFVVGWLAVANLTLAAFNLLPAFPMDGGRVLRALLARNRPYASATRIAGRVGVVLALLFAALGVFSFNVLLVLLALFIYGAATTESRTVLLDELLDGITVGDIMSRDPATIPADATVEAFVSQLLRNRQAVYPVTDAGGAIVGIVTLDDLRKRRPEERSSTRIAALAREVPRVPSVGDAFDTLAALSQAGTPNALVETDGAIVGVLSQSDFARAMTIQRGFRSGPAR